MNGSAIIVRPPIIACVNAVNIYLGFVYQTSHVPESRELRLLNDSG